MDEWFAGWKASPCRWKDAGETVWWRHGRCGQVARKDAAGRSPVHPFVSSRHRLPAAPSPFPSPSVTTGTRTVARIHGERRRASHGFLCRSPSLSLLLLLLLFLLRIAVPRYSLFFFFFFISPFFFLLVSIRLSVSALDPNASAVLTKLPVFVLRGIAGYRAPRV